MRKYWFGMKVYCINSYVCWAVGISFDKQTNDITLTQSLPSRIDVIWRCFWIFFLIIIGDRLFHISPTRNIEFFNGKYHLVSSHRPVGVRSALCALEYRTQYLTNIYSMVSCMPDLGVLYVIVNEIHFHVLNVCRCLYGYRLYRFDECVLLNERRGKQRKTKM